MTLVPASSHGGSSSPVVSCVPEVYPLDVHALGVHTCLWNALYNNINQFTPLSAIPAGLGMTFAFDGSSADITTTAAGVWALTMSTNFDLSDATWAGVFTIDNTLDYAPVASVPGGSQGYVSSIVVPIPSGTLFTPSIHTTTAATNNPLNMTVDLVIVRLA